MPTDISEKGLESLIVESLVTEAKYELGDPKDYDRDYAVDLAKLLAFLRATQPQLLPQLDLEEEGPKRQQFLARLQGEITKRGVVDVLRKGINHGPVSVDLFYGTPTPGNPQAEEQYRANIFSVTRQLRYSKDETQLALDLCIFINGLKTIEDDPEFDTRKAKKKLRHFVESHQHAIREKAEIMVDHFHQQVMARRKIGGQARAMVVTGSIARAIQYFHAFVDYLAEIKSPYKAIVAFSGEPEYGGVKVTEASLNGFASNKIADRIQEDPYRFLIAAEKFQTGYDEPLLHTMYVDKLLSGIKAVQTLSRLNRARPQKHDTFVLDFMNDTDTIQKAFEPYYRTTILSKETDPNKVHDLKAALDGYQVYTQEQVQQLVSLYLESAKRDQLDPILDACVAVYKENLDEDGQVDFKGKSKAFVRTYSFLASILPYSIAQWEVLSTFLNFLIPKLPAPKEEDLAKGILETVDMDSYRVEVKASLTIALPDEDGTVEPVPTSGGGKKLEPELDHLSNIIKDFNDQFGNIEWKDVDKIRKLIAEEIPAKVSADKAYQNAIKNSDRQNARIEHDKALERVVVDLLTDHMELFKQFSENPSFIKWLRDSNFNVTYQPEAR